jgi:cysteine desulfurase family protein (TIGR01976 family)
MTLEPHSIREQFPAINRPVIFLDNPGGTQIARQSLERITGYLVDSNANHGGNFATSRDSDAVVDAARAAAADLLNAALPEEVVLGPNMTSLTFRISRALAPTFHPGETLVVTRLDHDANVSPWVRMAEDRGMRVRWVDFDPETGMLDMNDMRRAMQEKPRLVAAGYASNALGTAMAKEAGALTYIDAVQYAPHGPIDVQQLGCDFLVCSAYKFFGPHVGVLYGRYDLLESLRAYRVRPAPALPPGKFETGTNNFEGIAGLLGAIEYLEWVGKTFGGELLDLYAGEYGPRTGRRATLKAAMSAIRSYETEISRAMLRTLHAIRGVRIYGPAETEDVALRVPTFSFTKEGYSAQALACHLDTRGINTWDGNFYAINVTERLGLEAPNLGLLRAGAVHYNTLDEIDRFGAALEELA